MSLSVLRSYVTRLFEVDTDFKNVFTLKMKMRDLLSTREGGSHQDRLVEGNVMKNEGEEEKGPANTPLLMVTLKRGIEGNS